MIKVIIIFSYNKLKVVVVAIRKNYYGVDNIVITFNYQLTCKNVPIKSYLSIILYINNHTSVSSFIINTGYL